MSLEKLVLIDPHGGHNNVDPINDDGLTSPAEMVSAALNRGIIPAITSHNSTAGWSGYLHSMRSGRLIDGNRPPVLCGVEFSYMTESTSLDRLADPRLRDDEVIAVAHPSIKGLGDMLESESTQSLGVMLKPSEIRLTRDFIYETLLGKLKPDLRNEILDRIQKGDLKVWAPNVERWLLSLMGPLSTSEENQYIFQIGLIASLTEKGFPAFYLTMVKSENEKVKDLLKDFTQAEKIVLYGYIFNMKGFSKKYQGVQKGELIFIIPDSIRLRLKFKKLVDYWRESGNSRQGTLNHLLGYLRGNMSQGEWDGSLRYLPHPFSIDTTVFGKFLVRMLEGKWDLFPDEIIHPDIATALDAIEVLNGAHPGKTNNLSNRLANHPQMQNLAKMGGSDNHHPAWSGAAATVVRLSGGKLTTENIIGAIKDRDTIAVSGLGEKSLGWWPFFAWSLLVPVKRRWHVTPNWVIERIRQTINIEQALESLKDYGYDKAKELDDWWYDGKV